MLSKGPHHVFSETVICGVASGSRQIVAARAVNRSGLREATQNAKLLLQRLRSLPVLEAPASDEADPSADFDEARLAAGTQSRLQKLRDAAEIPAATEITGDDLLIGEGNGAEVEASKPKRKKGKKRKGKAPENVDPDLLINPGCPAGLLLSFAFPTRVARRHTAERDCFTLPHVRCASCAAVIRCHVASVALWVCSRAPSGALHDLARSMSICSIAAAISALARSCMYALARVPCLGAQATGTPAPCSPFHLIQAVLRCRTAPWSGSRTTRT